MINTLTASGHPLVEAETREDAARIYATAIAEAVARGNLEPTTPPPASDWNPCLELSVDDRTLEAEAARVAGRLWELAC